jgi:hypothetical protein
VCSTTKDNVVLDMSVSTHAIPLVNDTAPLWLRVFSRFPLSLVALSSIIESLKKRRLCVEMKPFKTYAKARKTETTPKKTHRNHDSNNKRKEAGGKLLPPPFLLSMRFRYQRGT